MHEKLKRIPSSPQRRYFSSVTHGALTLIAIGSRIIICPGDDILAVTAVATLGFRVSDTPREAVLPDSIKINFREENKNRNKNKV